jgi:phage baseplate assembly protein W
MVGVATVPKFQLPLRVGATGALQTVEQDSMEEIEQCLTYIITTPLGSRDDLPAFGVREQTFSETIDRTHLMEVMATWEPRAVTQVSDRFDILAVMDRLVDIAYKIEGNQ